MPHLSFEYSGNLATSGRFEKLCRKAAALMAATRHEGEAVFPLGGIRVRATPCQAWCIADGSMEDAGFVHGRLQIGAGRSPAARQAAGDAIFALMTEHFADYFAEYPLALSLEISEFSDAGTWKHNNIHARLAARG